MHSNIAAPPPDRADRGTASRPGQGGHHLPPTLDRPGRGGDRVQALSISKATRTPLREAQAVLRPDAQGRRSVRHHRARLGALGAGPGRQVGQPEDPRRPAGLRECEPGRAAPRRAGEPQPRGGGPPHLWQPPHPHEPAERKDHRGQHRHGPEARGPGGSRHVRRQPRGVQKADRHLALRRPAPADPRLRHARHPGASGQAHPVPFRQGLQGQKADRFAGRLARQGRPSAARSS